MLGLDGAGKTTVVSALRHEHAEALPTLGFAKPQVIKVLSSPVTFLDVGGGSSIRKIWPQYLAEVHGMVFVIDACDNTRLEEAMTEIKEVLDHPFASGKHFLVLANKQDGRRPCTPSALLEKLAPLAQETSLCVPTSPRCPIARALVIPMSQCRVNVVGCTAKITSDVPVPDGRLVDGIEWLVMAVQHCYRTLNVRVKREHAQHMQAEATLRQGRLQRGAESESQRRASDGYACSTRAGIPSPARQVGRLSGWDGDDGHALGEAFSWQVGVLSFGSLLGMGTYSRSTESTDAETNGNGQYLCRRT